MYRLQITDEEWRVIDFVGHRYSWSEALLRLLGGLEPEEGDVYALTEDAAYYLLAAFDEDVDRNHGYFPLLKTDSDLTQKLFDFMDAVV
jgi:hypothetical protein